jgi:hypothetical protein
MTKIYFDGKPQSKAEKLKAQVGMYMGTNVAKKKRKAAVRTNPFNDMREKEEERLTILALRMAGYDAHKTGETSTYNSMYCENGVLDITVKGLPFHLMYIEMKDESKRKTKDGGLRKSQIEFIAKCKLFGIPTAVVYNKREALETVRNQK